MQINENIYQTILNKKNDLLFTKFIILKLIPAIFFNVKLHF